MRARILEALDGATDEPPVEDYRRTTWELARAVVERDEELARVSKHYTSLEEVAPYRAPALASRAGEPPR